MGHSRGAPQHVEEALELQWICTKLVEQANLGILLGSEVAGFEQGFSNAQTIMPSGAPQPAADAFNVSELENNLAMWGFGGASSAQTIMPSGAPQPTATDMQRVQKRLDTGSSGAAQPAASSALPPASGAPQPASYSQVP